MDTGMISKNMLSDHMQTQMFAQKTKELVSLETILLTHVVDMAFVSSIT